LIEESMKQMTQHASEATLKKVEHLLGFRSTMGYSHVWLPFPLKRLAIPNDNLTISFVDEGKFPGPRVSTRKACCFT